MRNDISSSFKCPLTRSIDPVASPELLSQQITPLRGPREGGTLVTIRGENLGLEFREIQGNVKVAEVECTPIRDGYIPAEQ